jgi:cyclopropane-fatty-acyl-phospholipid synthase
VSSLDPQIKIILHCYLLVPDLQIMVNSTQTSGPLQALSGYVASYGWGPLLSVSRSAVLSLLSRIQAGHLKVVDADGKESTYGQKQVVNGKSEKSVYSLPNVELTVHKDVFWVRMLLFADMVIIMAQPIGSP